MEERRNLSFLSLKLKKFKAIYISILSRHFSLNWLEQELFDLRGNNLTLISIATKGAIFFSKGIW